VQAVVYPKPTEAGLEKGSVFNGKFSPDNTLPDTVCVLNTLTYNIKPPTGYYSSGYGTTWSISQLKVATAKGTRSSDFAVTYPSAKDSGLIVFAPSIASGDSTFIISFTVTDLRTKCENIVTRKVKVNSRPVAKVHSSDVCEGQFVYFFDSTKWGSQQIKSITYDFGDGTTKTYYTAINPVRRYAAPGVYKIKYTAINESDCEDTFVLQVHVGAKPKVLFTAKSVCVGEIVPLTNASSATRGKIKSYKWYFGDSRNSTSTDSLPKFAYDQPGSYTISQVVITEDGCKDSGTVITSIYTKLDPKFTFIAGCEGRQTNFKAVTKTAAKYLWDFGDGGSATVYNPGHLYTAPGEYIVRLTVTNSSPGGGGCDTYYTDTVTIYKDLVAGFTVKNVCLGEPVLFEDKTDKAGGVIQAWVWTFGPGKTSAKQNPEYTFPDTGSYTVKLKVQNGNGCWDSITKVVVIYPIPTVSFSASVTGKTAKFTSTGSGLYSYVWDFGDGGTSNASHPTHTYISDSKYKVNLTVTDTNGCIAAVSDSISIEPSGIREQRGKYFSWSIQPNPFNENFSISYTLEKRAETRITLYDLQGRQLVVLLNTVTMLAGEYHIEIKATDYDLQPGLYFLKLEVDGLPYTREIIRIR
jgi:PKD repeat protein